MWNSCDMLAKLVVRFAEVHLWAAVQQIPVTWSKMCGRLHFVCISHATRSSTHRLEHLDQYRTFCGYF